jgi:hypothetical protein
MKVKANRRLAHYFSLQVEVISQMQSCSLIRFRGQEFIIDTVDLVFSRELKRAA